MGEFNHFSVMLGECIDSLNVRPDGTYVDCTLGGGGHSEQIAKRLSGGRLVCIDRDDDAIEAAKKRLAPYADRITYVKDNFSNIKNNIFFQQKKDFWQEKFCPKNNPPQIDNHQQANFS